MLGISFLAFPFEVQKSLNITNVKFVSIKYKNIATESGGSIL